MANIFVYQTFKTTVTFRLTKHNFIMNKNKGGEILYLLANPIVLADM